MVSSDILINRQASKTISSLADNNFDNREKAVFAIVSDLEINSHYGSGAVYFSNSKLVAVNDKNNDVKTFYYKNIEKIFVKRMYGNAVLKIKTADGKKCDILRFTLP